LEAGLRLATHDVFKQSEQDGPPFGWRGLTRDRVVAEATRLKSASADETLKKVATGCGAFRDRWEPQERYLLDLTVYALYSSRWRDALESARRELYKRIDKVKNEELRFSELISAVAIRNIGLRIHLARYFIYQLMLIMDSRYRPLATEANAKIYQRHADYWNSAYHDVLRTLNLQLSPDLSVERFGIMLGRLAEGFALHAASSNDGYDTKLDKELFAQAVMVMVVGAVHSGDHSCVANCVDLLVMPPVRSAGSTG
jgi:hypothetical protein